MCNDEVALVENVRVSNMYIENRIRAGNWWGNGEPIFVYALKHDYYIPAEQKPDFHPECAVRNIYFDGITCAGQNAIGVVGDNGNIRGVQLRNIDYTRKPSENIKLKGLKFDVAPARITVPVSEDTGLMVTGAEDVVIENVNTREWKIIRK